MATYKLLSIDESGKASYNHSSEIFILSGVVIPEKLKTRIDLKMRSLKKRFFGNEEIVFHSRDMGRKKGPFSILRDSKTEVKFWSAFVSIVNNPEINLFFIIVNKKKAKKLNWQPKTILKKSYLKILEQFVKQLKTSGTCGKIITESEAQQDLYLIQAHGRIQSMGLEDKSISASEYRKMVTSLSLVNKSNLDIDVQIADALAPIAGMKYSIDILKRKVSLGKMEKMKKKLIERKIANKSNPSYFEILI